MSGYRTLASEQQAEIWVGGPTIQEPELLFRSKRLLIEAPNWSLDGTSLFVNGHGSLWRLDLSAPDRGLTVVDFQGLPELNNDHVLDPDGEHIYLSAMDGHIYRGLTAGGGVERVTPEDGAWHFLHGVSPDGERLAYVHIDDFAQPGRLGVMEPHRTPVLVSTGSGHLDGPEWAPDGDWIYVNTEAFTTTPGHAQIARIADDDWSMEQVIASDTVDWFPHVSTDGSHATCIAFPPGTLGHPPDVDVEIRVVATTDWRTPVQRYAVFGGQGTINVNSWSPDGARFAFVTYPTSLPDSRIQKDPV